MRTVRVGLKEIAERSGVSKPTVSLILNNKGDRYSPATRKRVLQMAEELGYIPNRAARATQKGQTSTITVLVSSDLQYSYMPHPLIAGMESAVSARGLHLNLAQIPDAELVDPYMARSILSRWSSDGLLINYHHCAPEQLAMLTAKYNIPTIWLNIKNPYDSVRPDDVKAGREITELLVKAGHRRIVFIDFTQGDITHNHYSIADRMEGYAQVMKEAGLAPRRFGNDIADKDRTAAIMDLFSGSDAPTGLVALTAIEATLCVHAVEVSGRRVPDDVCIVMAGAGGELILGKRIPLCHIPWFQMAATAVEMLVEKIESPTIQQPSIALPMDVENIEGIRSPQS